jgi:hypothetical protein
MGLFVLEAEEQWRSATKSVHQLQRSRLLRLLIER